MDIFKFTEMHLFNVEFYVLSVWKKNDTGEIVWNQSGRRTKEIVNDNVSRQKKQLMGALYN